MADKNTAVDDLRNKTFKEKDIKKKSGRNKSASKTILLCGFMIVIIIALWIWLGSQLWEAHKFRTGTGTNTVSDTVTDTPSADTVTDMPSADTEEVQTFGLDPGQTVPPAVEE